MDVVNPSFYGMPQIGVPAQFCSACPVFDAALETEFKFFLAGNKGEFIRAIRRSHIQEHFVVHDVVPAQ